MKINDFFNMTRFGLLVKHDLVINKNKYLLKIFVLFLSIYAFLIYVMSSNPQTFCTYQYAGGQIAPQGYVQLFIFGLIALGVFVGGSFSDLGSKVKRTTFILLPASTFEKILYPFLLRVVLGIGCYILFFWFDAHLALMTVANSPSILLKGLVLEPFTFALLVDGLGKDDFAVVMFALFSIGMYLFVVPMFFKKQALLKAIFVLFVGIFTYICFFALLSHLFHPGIYQGFNFSVPDYRIYKDLTSLGVLIDSIAYLSWVFLLVLGYYKLKELKL